MEKGKRAIGFISSLMLGFCAVPEVIATVSQGFSVVSYGFITMWGLGELGMLFYTLLCIRSGEMEEQSTYPAIINYLINIGLIAILLYYKR